MGVAVADGLTGLAVMGSVTLATEPDRRLRCWPGWPGPHSSTSTSPSSVFFGFSPFPQRAGRVPRPHPARVAAPDAAGAAGGLTGALLVAALTRRARGRS